MSEFLQHFGILKMKWGVRRFQNPDGTLTEAGKLRYRKSDVENDFHETLAKHPKEVGHIRESGPKLDKRYDRIYDRYKKELDKIELTDSQKTDIWEKLRYDFSSGSQVDDTELFNIGVYEHLGQVNLLQNVSPSLKKERADYEKQYKKYREQIESVIADLTEKYGDAKLEASKPLSIGPSNLSAHNYIQSLVRTDLEKSWYNPLKYHDFDDMVMETANYIDAEERIAKEFSLEEFKKRYP